ncbi:hypothetical protein DV515_00010862, partial [Chloebia gouldiae]
MPCHATAGQPAPVSQPQCPSPSVPAPGEEPRRQQQLRTSGPGPAARESAVLTFLPPQSPIKVPERAWDGETWQRGLQRGRAGISPQ